MNVILLLVVGLSDEVRLMTGVECDSRPAACGRCPRGLRVRDRDDHHHHLPPLSLLRPRNHLTGEVPSYR